jgi:SAM-dependent methyltransferase
MSPHERLEVAKILCASPTASWIDETTVRSLDAFLRDEFQIAPILEDEEVWEACLASDCDEALYLRFCEVADARRACGGTDAGIEAAFYDCAARLGTWLHSPKRTYILDSIAIADHLLTALEIRGAVLDVGCNGGYATHWLSRQHPNSFTGVDYSQAAIEYATAKSDREDAKATFRTHDYLSLPLGEKFEMILSVDAVPVEPGAGPTHLKWIFDHLEPGGVAVVVGNSAVHFTDSRPTRTKIRRAMERSNVGFAGSTLVGGFITPSVGWESKGVLIFIKDTRAEFPQAPTVIVHDEWPEFASYANDAAYPYEEKTQAYFRAREHV